MVMISQKQTDSYATSGKNWWDSITGAASDAYDYFLGSDDDLSPTISSQGSNLSKASDIYKLIDAYNASTKTSSGGSSSGSSSANPFGRLLALGAGGIGGLLAPDLLFGNKDTAGYKGSVPEYDAVRARVPNTFDPNRRPGSGGQRYFSDTQFVPKGQGDATAEAIATEAKGLASLNQANPASYPVKTMNMGGLIELIGQNPQIIDILAYLTAGTGLGGLGAVGLKKYKEADKKKFNVGGIAAAKKGMYLDGATDGMADKIPAMIDGEQPAMLSDGEFVIPADVVSHLGNGNSDAGADELETMMNEVRMARTGTKKQAPEIDPANFLPT
tara:strand:+ start:331 stop:1317 length:987 start_codon:yes stop_codon:yes gene_type:complete